MNQTITPTAPTTLEQVKQTNNYIIAAHHAHAYVIAGERLNTTPGPITSRKLFAEDGKIVYEYYRARNKEQKLYVIF